MEAKSLRLKNFRNYKEQEITFSPGVNLITGQNAQGKTNILEALYYLGCGRSFRGAQDREMLMQGAGSFDISLEFSDKHRDMEISVRSGCGKKRFLLNRVPQKRTADIVGVFCSVLFAPEHMSLVKGGPGERRRFLDMALSQLKPAYFGALCEYQRILNQKAALLKTIREGCAPQDALDLWNRPMAALCALISKERGLFIEKLSQFAAPCQHELSEGKEELVLKYEPSPAGNEGKSLSEGEIYSHLERMRSREGAAGSCLYGIHRDNFAIYINGADARVYGSQGQQRSAVLALKTAECALFHDAFGEHPVLLLDDMLSELDSFRRSFILGRIKGGQVILTSCDPLSAGVSGTARKLFVENGHVY